MFRLVLWEPEALFTTRTTAYDPAAAKAWVGLRSALVAPSLKFHCQDVGLPVERSENCTV